MPGLTIATDAHPAPATTAPRPIANPRRASASSRTSPPPSPSRPPISPITPMLGPTQLPGAGPTGPGTSTSTTAPHHSIPDFALGRPTFTHTTQTDQTGVAPPPAPPIDFDSNPDVLALKSAISILQLQRARATADIQSLSRAREAALGNPASFVADLQAGKVRVEGDPLFSGARATAPAESESESSSDSDSDSDSEPEPERQGETPDSIPKPAAAADGDTSMPDAPPNPTAKNPKQKGKQKPSPSAKPPAWQNLPKPQTIVRCPPINWAQYGVVGDSLDKLHAEQLAAPTPGAPAVLGSGGAYEFRAGGGDQAARGSGSGGGGEQARRLVGVAAPYNPLRDKLEKKGKGGKR